MKYFKFFLSLFCFLLLSTQGSNERFHIEVQRAKSTSTPLNTTVHSSRKTCLLKSALKVFAILFIGFFFVSALPLSYFSQTTRYDSFQTNPFKELEVFVQTSYWSKPRVAHANSLCNYFKKYAHGCHIVNGFKGSELNTTYKEYYIKKGYLKRDLYFWNALGKVGSCITAAKTFEIAYHKLQNDKNHTIKYILLLEDDANILDFHTFKSSFFKVISNLNKATQKKWDLLSLSVERSIRNRHYIWLDLRPVKNPIFYPVKKQTLFKWHYFFLLTQSVLYQRSGIEKLYKQLPLDEYQDLWIGKKVKKGIVDAYASFPPLFPRKNFPSEIEHFDHRSNALHPQNFS